MNNGSNFGVRFTYAEQPRPEGLAQGFIIGGEFIGNDDVCLVLGDKIFYSYGLVEILNVVVISNIMKRLTKMEDFQAKKINIFEMK